jgi:hypothetical protein
MMAEHEARQVAPTPGEWGGVILPA